MKKVSLLGFVLMILSSCQEPNNCKDTICVTDSRLINEWEILQECLCYNLGGDFIWKEVSEKYFWGFGETCKITETDETQSNCNSGKYSISDDMLSVTWFCSNSHTTTAEYQFSVSLNGDTLTVKGFVDEGYIGQKFIKKQ